MCSFTPIHSSPLNFTQGSGKRTTPSGPLTCGSGGGEVQLKPRPRSIANRKTAQGRIRITSLHGLDRTVAVERLPMASSAMATWLWFSDETTLKRTFPVGLVAFDF